MSSIATGSQHMSGGQMVTAFFDDHAEATAAIDRIVATGVASDDVSMIAGTDSSATTAVGAEPTEERGFFEALGDFFMPDEDRYTYAEGLRRGGYLVSVTTTAANRDAVLDILDDEGTVDMDAREESWRSEGWASTGASAVASGRSHGTSSLAGTATTGGMASTTTTAGLSSGIAQGDGTDGKIDVVEESLKVGKRDVSHGRVRVRSYVVEDAVSQDVNLRSEHVEIERRAVDRPVGSTDAAFRDQTIELEEKGEEAVVSKEARVKEEIDLRTVGETRTETVSDTVRRTEVEIEDERSGEASRVTGTDARVGRDV